MKIFNKGVLFGDWGRRKRGVQVFYKGILFGDWGTRKWGVQVFNKGVLFGDGGTRKERHPPSKDQFSLFQSLD